MRQRNWLVSLAGLGLWWVASMVNAATPAIVLDEIPRYSPDTILVSFQPGTPGATKSALHAQNGGRVIKRFNSIGFEVVSVPAGSVEQMVARYSNNPNVRIAEPDYYKVMIIPDEGQELPPPDGIGDYWKEQWGLHNTGTFSNYLYDPLTGNYTPVPVVTDADADIDAPEAWDVFLAECPACTPTRIAVLDSGVDCLHPDLTCDNDINVAGVYVPGVPPGDLLGHGTHVAGIAAAENNNNIGIAGVSWSSTIGSYKVCYAASVGGQIVGLCNSSAIVDALGQATDEGYDVINMSYGGPDVPAAEVAALDTAAEAGIVLVSSAGNNYLREGCTFPSTHTSVIAVGATDFHDNLSSYSNFGSCASVLAPGTNIFSTFPLAACPADPQGCYTWLDGTSMAGPVVAGLAAMARAVAPTASAVQVRDWIEQNTDAIGARGQNMLAWSAFGRVNAAATLSAATNTPPPPPPPPVEEMYVWNIDMYMRGPNLNIDVFVKWDSDGDGVAEVSDAAAVGATLSVQLCPVPNTGNCNFTTTAVATDSNGKASYKARQASGNYTFQVTNMTHAQYTWNAALDQNNPQTFP